MARKRPGRKAGGSGGAASGGAGSSNGSGAANANGNENATAPAATATAAPPPPRPPTSSLPAAAGSAAAAPKKQQPRPIPSSFEAARSSSETAATAAAAAAAAATTAAATAAAPAAAAASSPRERSRGPPRRPSASASAPRPGSSGFEGTLSAGPSELAGYADGGTTASAAEEEEEAAADPERATATAAARASAAANGNQHHHHHHGGASVSNTVVTLLSLQLGWGLWLLPADFARLGWAGAGAAIAAVALLTAYSASLFPRLVAAVEGAVLFGDVGEAAAGRKGRAAVYAIIYTLDASRCVVLHLAATQALQHAAGNPPHLAQWRFGLVVALLSLGLAQARNLAHMSKLLAAGTAAQLFAVSVVMTTLITKPDREAPPTRLFEHHGWVRTSVAVLNVFFAYGGQFAFTEVIVSMRRPARFARAAGAATAAMTLAYATLGAAGYASRGARVHEIVIFALGEGPWERAAAAAVLLQALAQYLVNVNVWVHNLLVLLSRAREERSRKGKRRGSGGGEGEEPLLLPPSDGGEAEEAEAAARPAPPRTAADHARGQWALATLFVVAYSFGISMSLPFFSSLVGLLVAGTYLMAAYALPCWFALRLLAPAGLLSPLEARWCRFLIGGSAVVSAVGLAASASALWNNIGGGPAA